MGEKHTASYEYWDFGNFRFIEHVAVDKKERGNGIGTRLLTYVLRKCTILEAEPPINAILKRKISFYERHGFCINSDFEYKQPPYNKRMQALPLILMSYPKRLDNRRLKKIKLVIYAGVYGVKSPLQN